MSQLQEFDELINDPKELQELADEIEMRGERAWENTYEELVLEAEACPVCEAYRGNQVNVYCDKHAILGDIHK